MTYLATESQKHLVIDFLQQRIGMQIPVGAVQVLGWMDEDDQVIGGWLFERYTGPGGSVHAHWAGPTSKRWLTKGMLALVAIYIFDQLEANVVYGEVRKSDEYVRAVDERMGFVEAAVLPGYFPDDDLVIYSMNKQQCRFLPSEYKEPPDGKQQE